ncbi:tRNA (5-methylaminomethyl-2-thiouridylate)-methyltransferase [Cryptococcus depauperatus]
MSAMFSRLLQPPRTSIPTMCCKCNSSFLFRNTPLYACRGGLVGYVHALLPTMEELGLKEGDFVTVGMSGGVDSATALCILKQFPIHLDVVFMRNWDPLLSESDLSEEDSGSQLARFYSSTSRKPNLSPCEWERDWNDVMKIATHVGIPKSDVRLVDLSKEYWSRVFEPAIGVWGSGATPNPDISCNREIKFGALLHKLPKENRHFLATGHYGRILHSPGLSPRLFRAVDSSKDQTYYLSQISDYQLSRSILPLGGLLKTEVRQLAEYWNLPNAKKAESMGVCFIGERNNFGDFISQYTSPPETGYLVTLTGDRLGEHKGLWHYTIGQRARIANQHKPMFVAKKGVGQTGQDILVVPGSNHLYLCCQEIIIGNFFWIHGNFPHDLLDEQDEKVQVQVRHRMEPVHAQIRKGHNDKSVNIYFKEPLVGVSPGQFAAIWYDGWCLGSGAIQDTICPKEVSD